MWKFDFLQKVWYNIYRKWEKKRRWKVKASSDAKFFQKIFLRLRYLTGVFLSWVFVPLPGSRVGMAHVLMSLSPYIIPPCGRATCLGEHMMVPPRGTHWDSYVGHMTMRKPSWREAALMTPRFYENFSRKIFEAPEEVWRAWEHSSLRSFGT